VWNWSDALLGAVCALPAAAAATADPARGAAMAVGVIPAVIVGLRPTRRARRASFLLGVLVGVPIVIGAAVAAFPWLAVASLVALAIGAVELTRRLPAGRIALVLGLPMVGIGLSFTDLSTSAGLALLMIAGSIYAAAVSMLWPERAPSAAPPPTPRAPRLEYGVRLGLAGAVAAGVGFALDLEHVGWACTATLLVMRPSAQMVQLRAVGRLLSVATGATIAVLVVEADPPGGFYALAGLVAVAAASATHRSRWYVTAAFTTFLVFLLLLVPAPQDASSRWGERVAETAFGVALAYLFGVGVPWVQARLRTPADAAGVPRPRSDGSSGSAGHRRRSRA
jgi:hypothetical protein